MYKIFKEIEDYLKQNNELIIHDIIVNYNTSLLLRKHHSFKYSDKYKYNNTDDTYLDKDCYFGNIILNDVEYKLLGDITLEDSVINFN